MTDAAQFSFEVLNASASALENILAASTGMAIRPTIRRSSLSDPNGGRWLQKTIRTVCGVRSIPAPVACKSGVTSRSVSGPSGLLFGSSIFCPIGDFS